MSSEGSGRAPLHENRQNPFTDFRWASPTYARDSDVRLNRCTDSNWGHEGQHERQRTHDEDAGLPAPADHPVDTLTNI